jgi:hypothetical protein
MIIPASLAPRVKVMQIVAAAIMTGLAVFIVIAHFVGQNNPPPAPGRTPVVTYLSLVLIVSAVPMAFVVPMTIERAAVQNVARQAGPAGSPDDPALIGRLLAVRQTSLIVSLALIEGAGFFSAIAYLIEREPLALGGALGALVLMATRFPTFAAVAAWLQRQKEAVAALRQRGGGLP